MSFIAKVFILKEIFPDDQPSGQALTMITYEHPFNERIRTLLRLEDLFDRIRHFAGRDDPCDHHAALFSLFEMLEVVRSDLKKDLLQELEQQRQTLLGFRSHPDISEEALDEALSSIEAASASILSLPGKFGQILRDNDWLMNIKSRAAVPGGACEFDLPAYHYWLNQPAETRRVSLTKWIAPMQPVSAALSIILKLLRSSGDTESLCAPHGQFQRMLDGAKVQLARIILPKSEQAVPAVSGNRFALNIRFVDPLEAGCRAKTCCNRAVPFYLTLCNF
ncbi:MAG: cell division protein ZapD [Zoogloeaceae bacterium]|nr:cell division protein ZapD [Zoogloeaceae bacterium]